MDKEKIKRQLDSAEFLLVNEIHRPCPDEKLLRKLLDAWEELREARGQDA